jgi:hypothetical protein
VRAIIDLCSTLHWMRRFWTQSLGVPVLYQIRLRVPMTLRDSSRTATVQIAVLA